MATIKKSTLQFLDNLKSNNNREWFNDNKELYKEALENFSAFIDELIPRIGLFDSSIAHRTAKDCIFRIYRDVRFSKDKSPYKTHFGAHITSAVKKSEIHSKAGYYIHIEPRATMLGGGAYLPQGQWLKAIRQEIHYNAPELKKIINSADFKKYFGNMEGEKLKSSPRDYPANHPEIELLKYKSFLATNTCNDDMVISEIFLNHCADTFKALYPFDCFLNNAVE